MRLYWHDMAPIPALPELLVWGGITEDEAAALRGYAAGKRVLEIGSAFGFSTLALASVAEHVWAIDPHSAAVIRGNFDLWEEHDIARLQAGSLAFLTSNLAIAGLTDRVTICRERSQDYLARETPDVSFAFIDGDNTFDGCMTDLRNCARIMETGVICVHDYECESGVREAVDHWGGQHDLVDSMAIITL